MRFEIPIARWSWVEDDRPVRLEVGEHCIDTDWPWLPPEWRDRPAAPRRRRRQPAPKRKGKRKRR